MELDREERWSDSENESVIDEPPTDLHDKIKGQADDIWWMSWWSNNESIIEPNKIAEGDIGGWWMTKP